MRWNRRYNIKSYIRSALWLVPAVALLLELAVSRLTHAIGAWLLRAGYLDEKTGLLGMNMAGARATLETIVTLNMSFMVFTFGSLLVAIQVASGQYTPRIIATTLLRDNAIRFFVGYFVFTLLFALRALHQMDQTVDQFNMFLSGFLGIGSLVIFLYLIDYAARMLRPVSIVARVAADGIAVIKSVYPQPTRRPMPERPELGAARAQRVVVHEGDSGIVLAVEVPKLKDAARRAGGAIEIVPQVGDFVAVDEPLFRLHGGATTIDDPLLRASVAFGTERTLEQDPTFAFRILVDIALKALSAAINDPTTAGLAIDQLHRLLRLVGLRHLRDEAIRDEGGKVRVVLRTPNWEDFVHLTFREIRQCGAGSIQIARRLRAMAENLMQTLPEHRHAALRAELDLLDRAIEAHYAFPEDIALARIADSQGLGGSERTPPEEALLVAEADRDPANS